MPRHSAKMPAVKLLAAALVVTGIGWLIDHPLAVFTVAIAILVIWNLFNLSRLLRWLNSPQTAVPESLGTWSEVFDRLNRMEKSRREQDENLRAVIRDFQNLTDALPDITLVIDKDDNITWFNTAARRRLGLKSPDDLGQPVTNLLRDPDFANWLSVQGQIQSHLEMQSPADDYSWFKVSAVHYHDTERLLILRDISDVHRVDQVRRDFVANISHELRTPLTVLLGYLEMLQQDEDSAVAGIAEKMQSQADLMQDLLADLLELSRLQNDTISQDEGTIAMPAMLTQLKEQMQEVSQGQHELRFEVQEDLNLRGVASDIESACRNLMLNAIRYTPKGGTIIVSWRHTGSEAVFQVRDNGIGIPKREIPRLTERFYRVQSDRSRATGGTGLGLSIVKHVLNAHQARLSISSELDQGSTFACHFPDERTRLLTRTAQSKAS